MHATRGHWIRTIAIAAVLAALGSVGSACGDKSAAAPEIGIVAKRGIARSVSGIDGMDGADSEAGYDMTMRQSLDDVAGFAIVDASARPQFGGVAAGTPEAEQAATVEAARKLIRRGGIRVAVEQYAPARKLLDEALEKIGGFVDRAEVHHVAGKPSGASLTLRVPAGEFGGFLDVVRDLGEVQSESLSSEDITAQYVDLEARMRNAQRLERRMLELLDDRTAELADVVAVERELAQVRERIERMDAQKRTFDNLVALATLTVELLVDELYTPIHERTFGADTADTFSASLGALGDVGRGIVLVLVALVPWSPLIALIVFAVSRRFKRARAARPVEVAGADAQA